MSDFKIKMHQIRSLLRLRPLQNPVWELTALSQIPWLYLRGLLLRGGRNKGKEGSVTLQLGTPDPAVGERGKGEG